MDRKILLLLLGSLLSLQVATQPYPWRLDFSLSATGYSGDLSDHPFHSPTWRPAVGLGLQRQTGRLMFLKTNIYHGRLYGNDRYFTNADWPTGDRNAFFNTAFTEWSLAIEHHLLTRAGPAPEHRALPVLSPYLALGGGLVIYEPRPYFAHTRNPELIRAIRQDSTASFARIAPILTLQAGLSWQFNPRWSVALQANLRPTMTDFLDGINQAGNPADKDWYASADLRFQYHFAGRSDRDGDGIADQADKCPTRPGLGVFAGCPDTDGDGIPDPEDRCPHTIGIMDMGGCPDRDRDGIADKDDLCPDEFGPLQRGGCPARDRDRDGIEDEYDLCPDRPGPPEREGCPAIDTDQDGILDEDDRCPQQFGLAIFTGCPDTDGDGIEDSRDACPTVFGVYTHHGCPEIIFPEDAVNDLNQEVLIFEPGSADIPRYALLDRIAEFLQNNPSYKITINGFTDEAGSMPANQRLSRARARACYRYLADTGITSERITYQGLGAKSPIGTTSPPGGQLPGRRVEFYLYK